mgnify:FL=1
MQARFVIEGDDGKKPIPVGTVTEHPDCYMLVQMGVCEPVDDECRQRADMTDEQMQAAQDAYRKLMKIGVQDVKE